MAGLPTATRVHVPDAFVGLDLPDDANPLLVEAAATADTVDPILAIVTASGDALRAIEPAERSDLHRTWTPVTVTAPYEGLLGTWWVRGTVARTDSVEEGEVRWSMEGSRSSDPAGDGWALLGNGGHSADGTGWMWWDLYQTAALFQTDAYSGYLYITYGQDELEVPWSIVEYYAAPVDAVPLATWGMLGDTTFGYDDFFDLGDDGTLAPGAVAAVYLPEGGRALGAVDVEGTPTRLDACWAPDGRSLWYLVDPGGPNEGSPDDCLIPPLDDFAEELGLLTAP